MFSLPDLWAGVLRRLRTLFFTLWIVFRPIVREFYTFSADRHKILIPKEEDLVPVCRKSVDLPDNKRPESAKGKNDTIKHGLNQ